MSEQNNHQAFDTNTNSSSNTNTNTKKGLIVMAHGSRNPNANTEFIALIDQIRSQQTQPNGARYSFIHHCFLELAEPTLEQAIEVGLSNGLHHFDLYPLFFNQGNHVTRDIPQQIKQTQLALPECHINQLDYFGTLPSLANAIQQHINEQL